MNALLIYKSALKSGKTGKAFKMVLFWSYVGYIFSSMFLFLHFLCSLNRLCIHSNAPLSLNLPKVLCKCCKGSSSPIEILDLCSKVTFSRLIQAFSSSSPFHFLSVGHLWLHLGSGEHFRFPTSWRCLHWHCCQCVFVEGSP